MGHELRFYIDAIFFVAGVLKGILGIGLPVVCMSVLTLLMPPAEAAKLLVIPAIATNAQQAFVGGRFLELMRRHAPLLMGTVIGTVALGATILSFDTRFATAALGAVLLIYAWFGLRMPHVALGRNCECWLGPTVGGMTGAIAAATGVLSVPAVPYLQSLDLGRDEFVQSLGITFFVSTLALLAVLAPHIDFNVTYLADAAELLLVSLAGMTCGQYLRRHLNPANFRTAFLIVIAVMGGSLLQRGLSDDIWTHALSVYDLALVGDE